jgi:hypothetical protein
MDYSIRVVFVRRIQVAAFSPSQISAKRLLLEGAAIVASILLAFAIDAWWGERADLKDEEAVLAALLADFRQAKEMVKDRRNSSVIIQNATNELMKLSYDPESSLDPDSLDQLLGKLTWWFPGGQIPTGALNSLVYGGKLGAIRNDQLRLDIADWPRKIDYLQSGLSQDYDVFFEVYIPYLRGNGYLPQIATSVTQIPGESDPFYQTAPIPPSETVDHSILLADKRFHNILIQVWWVQADAQALLDRADEWLDASIRRIEEQLEH